VIFRLPYITALISIALSVTLFFLFEYFSPRDSVLPGEGYAVLAVGEAENDRFIREILEREGIYNVISESSQIIQIYDFGGFRAVQLDNFHNEVAYFDPRDTGFAAKLTDFFVHDGMRFFFIPLEGLAESTAASLNNRLEAIFYGIPFSVSRWEQEPPFLLYFTLFTLGCVFTFIFSRSKRLFFYQLPVLLAMGWGGFSTAILAALLCGIWELLREPLRELLTSSRNEGSALYYAGTGFAGLLERLKPFRKNLFFSFLFLCFIVIFFAFVSFPFLPVITACLFFFFLNFMAFQVEKEKLRESSRVPFIPVLFFPVRTRTFSLFPFLLPFASISLFALSLPLLFPGFSPHHESGVLINPAYFVSAEDHYRHFAFQRSFPYRSLNYPAASSLFYPFYTHGDLRYYLGSDGLIAGRFTPIRPFVELPPFPLEKLIEFLLDYDNRPAARAVGNTMNTVDWISVLIIFTVCAMDIARPRGLPKKKIPVFRDKRIAA